MTQAAHKTKTSSRLRAPGRWVALIAAALLSLPLWPAGWPSIPLASFSPFVALSSLLATRTLAMVTLLGLPALVLALIWRRWFCRQVCPLGLLLELVARLRRAGPRRWRNWPPVGRWLAILTLVGAAVGYPLTLWLDPLAIFNGAFSAWRAPLTLVSVCAGLLLPLVLLLEVWQPQFWCARLCPLGGVQETLHRRLRGAFPRDRIAGRRGFLAAGVGLLGGLFARAASAEYPPLRPPGSLDEESFAGVCLRCGNCTRVCPTRVLRPDVSAERLTGLLAPVMEFDRGYCRENCNECGQVCPSGAIRRLPLEEKRRQVVGLPALTLDACQLVDGGECTLCIRSCPYEALSVYSDGFDSRPNLDPDKCIGCGACESVCPVRPQRAIRVFPRAEAAG